MCEHVFSGCARGWKVVVVADIGTFLVLLCDFGCVELFACFCAMFGVPVIVCSCLFADAMMYMLS